MCRYRFTLQLPHQWRQWRVPCTCCRLLSYCTVSAWTSLADHAWSLQQRLQELQPTAKSVPVSPALLPGAGTSLLCLPSSSSPCLAASSWCWFSTSCMSLQEGTGHFSIFFNFYQFFPIFPIFYPLSGNCAWAPRVEGEAHWEQNRTEAGCGHCHHLPAPGSPVVSHKATSQELSAK